MNEPPVRLCCLQRHWGAQCPDGLVMCTLCFERKQVDDLWADEKGQRWDICQACQEAELARA